MSDEQINTSIGIVPLVGKEIAEECLRLATLCDQVGVKNGRTALYWHLVSVCTKHMGIRDEVGDE